MLRMIKLEQLLRNIEVQKALDVIPVYNANSQEPTIYALPLKRDIDKKTGQVTFPQQK